MKKELISIIMPCYKVEKYIGKAIESILNQTYKNIELIIINDSTPDKSIEIAKRYQEKDNRIKIFDNEEEPHNISGVMNTGLKHAEGYYVTRVDSDDFIDDEKIEKQYNYLQKNETKNIILCSTNMYFVDKKGKNIKARKPLDLPMDFDYKFLYLFENPLPAAPCMFIKKIIDENNLKFDLKYKTAEDFDFISRYLQFGNYGLVNEPLYYYRLLNTGITATSGSKTNINSIEICERNVRMFLNLDLVYYHKYLTKYVEYNVFEKNKKLNQHDDVIGLSTWANKIYEVFIKKYKIPKNEQNKYYKYLNNALKEYSSYLNNNYIFINCNIFSRTVYFYKLYGFKKTMEKIKNKILRKED